MTFTFPKSALPPERTVREKIEFHLSAMDQYQKLRAAYVQKRGKEDKANRRRTYGHNSTIEPPPEGEGIAPPPAGE